ncbi:uncharacterized protein PITG_03072 [Phytophthora infestans T30-4]|uniref:Uncharacterized protein n=1 Tax=Phytophthora infestans (strain T30-4) TaxID=403677 RepID=D0MZB0_PHYIT|nr:uncharacterized protein PITG_03072 [Phytophthora infestans T30-4]EEY65573.1 conserved hypothetical protein [Phytophthora infestans T30-4]|eukprot:XP_002906172.1 conserved hypothetical protein [Phytophthora infestans T30-4]
MVTTSGKQQLLTARFLKESNVPVMCTGDEVFEYMRRVIAESRCTGKSLELDLRIGGLQNGHPRLYSVAVELLRRLAAISESDFGAASRRQKYEVYLVNPYRNRANRQWSSTYMRHELRPLMERVKDAFITSYGFAKFDVLILSWSSEHFNDDMFSYTVDEGDPYDDPHNDFPLCRANLLSVLFE